MKRSWLALVCAGMLTLLAACGGGADPQPEVSPKAPSTVAGAQLRSRTAQALAQRAGGRSAALVQAVSTDIAIDLLFNFAESQFPEYFPGHQASQVATPFRFRHYPQTGVYLGVVTSGDAGYELEGVYAMGGTFGASPLYIGPLQALIDFDQDGVPNSDDVAPLDALCSAASDAADGQCHLRAMAGARLKVVGNAAGKLFFSAEGDALLLYAYDLKTRHFIGRTAMTGYTPTALAYAPDHQRLYVGDTAGNIHAYSESLVKTSGPLARIAGPVTGLVAAGKYLLAHDNTGAWGTQYLFDKQGIQTDKQEWSQYSSWYEWVGASSRVYYFQDGFSPNDLLFKGVDQATGKMTSSGESPYHGDYSIRGPIRANRSGTRVLLGSGDLYAAPALTWVGKITVNAMVDAAWLADDELLVASGGGSAGELVVQRFGADRVPLERLPLGPDSELLAMAQQDATTYLVMLRPTHVDLHAYVPSDDSDGDGVPNLSDRFPLDKAAAVDTDGDGYPDAWLPGRTQADSSTGLTLDAYPQDASCHAPEQGNGTSCNPAFHAPPTAPDRVLSDGQGTVFLFIRSANRVYRWSGSSGNYIAPLVVGQPGDAGVQLPTTIAYSPEHRRLYLGYDSGRITFLEASGSGGEKSFGATAMAVRGLAAAGKFVVAQDDSGAWATHYVFDKAGVMTDSKDWNYFSYHYAWAANQNRLYFFRDDTSPNDLMFEEIDPVTGKITGAGDSPYHGDHVIVGPIRVSSGGGRIVLGNGDVYSSTDLTVVKSLGANWVDAQWLADGRLAGLSLNGVNARLTVYTSAFVVQREHLLDGQPVAAVVVGGQVAVFTMVDGVLRATTLTP